MKRNEKKKQTKNGKRVKKEAHRLEVNIEVYSIRCDAMWSKRLQFTGFFQLEELCVSLLIAVNALSLALCQSGEMKSVI